MVIPPAIYETVQALGYHHLGNLYTGDNRVLQERTLKEWAPARKGMPGLRAWLTRHAAVLVALLREPPPRWQAAPKDRVPAAVPTYRADVVIGGRVAKTTRMVTVYHKGQPLRVTVAMQDTMEVANWVPELRELSARTIHTAPPVYLCPWVDIPAFCHLVTAPSAHHTTPHHTTPHHTTPHHTTPHHTPQLYSRAGCRVPGGGLPLDWFDHDQQRHITAHRMDNVPTMAVLAHRSSHRGTVLDTTCLPCGTQPETAPHLWACSAQSHEWGPARRRLAAWLDQKVGPRAAPVRHQLWEPTVLEQWAAALRTPSMQLAHLECTGPHSLGTEFLRHVVEESIRIWYAHAKARATLLKARLGPGSTMAWALQELRLHQQAEREGVQRELLE